MSARTPSVIDHDSSAVAVAQVPFWLRVWSDAGAVAL